MFFNDTYVLECLLIVTMVLLKKITNPLVFIYLSGIILFLFGFLILILLNTIFIGFLWTIDLGLGVIAILIILTLTKLFYYSTDKQFLFFNNIVLFFVSYYFWCYTTKTITFNTNYLFFYNNIFFYNFYNFYNSYNFSELHLIRYVYFYNNISEFVIINIFLLYAILFVLHFFYNIFWLLKKTNNLHLPLKKVLKLQLNTSFIRTQNFSKQLSTTASVFFWKKK